MKLGVVVNLLGSAEEGQTTYRLAATAAARGHQVWMMSAGRFRLEPDGRVYAAAQCAEPRAEPARREEPFPSWRADAGRHWIALDDLDVLLLRNNPAAQTPWAQHAGIHFGRIAMKRGCIVLNHPPGLEKAMTKLYLRGFPETVQPRTLVTRSRKHLRGFAREQGTMVLKPLVGYGGRGVFVVGPGDLKNLDEIIWTIARDGYVIAQEYLAAAANGDTRLFLMNGVPLRVDGHYAAFRRVRGQGDVRSNIHAGGRIRHAKVNRRMLEIAEAVRPGLVEDGMFLVGLDIVGDKLLEINVFSPGGLGNAARLEGVDFTRAVVEALERKVGSMGSAQRNFSNVELATL
jgi:glutathione synthase